jgi:CubicO group peptidase (beta-lactamase class C family)
MKKLTYILLLATLISCQTKTESTQNQETALALIQDSLRSELEVIHQQGFINGFGVSIVNENGVLYADGFGYANVQQGSKYRGNTIQNIGSVSKTLIGVWAIQALPALCFSTLKPKLAGF